MGFKGPKDELLCLEDKGKEKTFSGSLKQPPSSWPPLQMYTFTNGTALNPLADQSIAPLIWIELEVCTCDPMTGC